MNLSPTENTLKKNLLFMILAVLLLFFLVQTSGAHFKFSPPLLFPGEKDEYLPVERVAVSKIPDRVTVPNLGSVQVDRDGNVFAYVGKYNYKECFVVKLDKKLRFVTKFGRYGKGPGEFTTDYNSVQNRLMIGTAGKVYLLDRNPKRLVVFDNGGKYIEDIAMEKRYSHFMRGIYNLRLVTDTIFAGVKSTFSMDVKQDKPPVGIAFTFPKPKVLFSYPYVEKRIFVKTGSMYTMGIKDPSYGDNCFLDTDGRHIVFGNSQIYRFHVYDPGGSLVLEVEKPGFRMSSFTEEELKRVGQSSARTRKNYPKHYKNLLEALKNRKNVIADIKISAGRVYLFEVPRDVTIENQYPLKIFNLKGKVIEQGYVKFLPDKIWQNYLFRIIRNDQDDLIIEKYQLRL